MTGATDEPFDFDRWSELARVDPAEFERCRLRAIERLVSRDPDTTRALRGLQWRIDGIRSLARNPLNACVKISALMEDSLDTLRRATRDPRRFVERKRREATILSLVRGRYDTD